METWPWSRPPKPCSRWQFGRDSGKSIPPLGELSSKYREMLFVNLDYWGCAILVSELCSEEW